MITIDHAVKGLPVWVCERTCEPFGKIKHFVKVYSVYEAVIQVDPSMENPAFFFVQPEADDHRRMPEDCFETEEACLGECDRRNG